MVPVTRVAPDDNVLAADRLEHKVSTTVSQSRSTQFFAACGAIGINSSILNDMEGVFDAGTFRDPCSGNVGSSVLPGIAPPISV